MQNDQQQAPSDEAIRAGYETSTVSIKGLAIFLVCLVVVAALVHLGSWFVFREFLHSDVRQDRPLSALTDPRYVTQGSQSTNPLPPSPRLQPTPGSNPQNIPPGDLQKMYEDENAIFTRLGWTVDSGNPARLGIPTSTIDAVITEESERQKKDAATQPARVSK